MKLHRNARLSVKGRELLVDRVENAVPSRPNYVHLNRNTRRRARSRCWIGLEAAAGIGPF